MAMAMAKVKAMVMETVMEIVSEKEIRVLQLWAQIPTYHRTPASIPVAIVASVHQHSHVLQTLKSNDIRPCRMLLSSSRPWSVWHRPSRRPMSLS